MLSKPVPRFIVYSAVIALLTAGAITLSSKLPKPAAALEAIDPAIVPPPPGPQPLKVALAPAAQHIVGDMSPRLCRHRRHIDQIELSIAPRQLHALAVMGLGLFEVGEWSGNRNNGVRIFDVGPCGDGGVPLPVKPTAKIKNSIGTTHPS